MKERGLVQVIKGVVTPKIYPPEDTISAFQVNKADGVSSVITINTLDNQSTFSGTISSSNLSGTNTGDETSTSIINKLGYTPENNNNKSTDILLSSNSDVLYPTQKAIKTYVDNKQQSSWISILNFNHTPTSTSTIQTTTDYTSILFPGDFLKYEVNSSFRYGQITAITSSIITLRGAPLLTTTNSLTTLSYSRTVEFIPPWSTISVNGYFADKIYYTLIETKLLVKGGFKWRWPSAYLIAIDISTLQDDSSGATAKVNIRRNGIDIFTYPGIIIPDGVYKSSIVEIDITQYKFNFNDTFEIFVECPSSGTQNYDAKDLTVISTFVRG